MTGIRNVSTPQPTHLLHAVLDATAEAVLLCDDQGGVLFANAAANRLMPGLITIREITDDPDSFERELHGRPLRGHRQSLDDTHDVWTVHDCTDEVARVAAIALERERTAFLVEASRRLSASLHRGRCVRTTVELAAAHLADAAVVVLPPSRHRVEWVRAVAGSRHETGVMAERDADGVPGLSEALAGFPPVPSRWLDQTQVPASLLPAGFGEIGALLVTPLPGNGVPAGALILARRAPGAFSDAEEMQARIFAARAGGAISAAVLYQEQVDTTAILQADLLPPELPRIEGLELAGAYRPAKDAARIGGDFYDAYPRTPSLSPDTGPAETMIVLGDVVGKGPKAAVLAGKVRQTLRALRLLEGRPEPLLRVLNQALMDPRDRSRFVTLVLASLVRDGDGWRVSAASGGHPPPLILRARGGVEEVPAKGTLIGVSGPIKVETADVTLHPGDLLLLYSDGLFEARGGVGGREAYGEDRLADSLASCRSLSATAVVERLEQLVSDWINGAGHDDIAMLAVRVPPRMPEYGHHPVNIRRSGR
ncbi:serine phosphatase RsbU (regulator of sigma subunit) [Catenuloplanes nepalensis]|uniref:Serine phosphatase RsbU (Regulator of sigma subunit) n=1 Tax=Catenuloplanes nepalensis TaxID=587533 RepID=A0ABT9MV35_9ACTN|nr:SpoIIE family protein phosphatase [Catenuloplanes nepalensis]MDP9795307.1 serine phosphatase RsbU (regulator of sigma subunit) [Catenuloplanes nepalensis]